MTAFIFFKDKAPTSISFKHRSSDHTQAPKQWSEREWDSFSCAKWSAPHFSQELSSAASVVPDTTELTMVKTRWDSFSCAEWSTPHYSQE